MGCRNGKEGADLRNTTKKDAYIEMLRREMKDIRYLPGMERKVTRDLQIPRDDMGRRIEPRGNWEKCHHRQK